MQQAHAATLRAQVTQRGDFVLIGNTLAQDCGAGVPAPVLGTVGSCGVNTADTAPDVFWQADTPAAGQAMADTSITASQARSTAMLSLPAGARVTHAWLYWAAFRTAGADDQVQLDVPFAGPQNIVAAPADMLVLNQRYRSVADVTALVQAHGAGAYRVSGVDSDALANVNDSNRFASWWMVVLYELDGQPVRHLAVHDGLDGISSATPLSVGLAGFRVPVGGGSARLGVAALDGDDTLVGDQLAINGNVLSDSQNPANNFFNGTHSSLGSTVSSLGDLPRLTGGPGSLSGLDLDVADISPYLAAGDTSATVSATTTGDVVFLATMVSSIDTAQPLLAGTMDVAGLDGAPLLPGHTLEYTVTVRNTGSGDATQVAVSDVLPAGTTYVPGSLRIVSGAGAGAKTDAAGDDQADYDAATRRWTVRLGVGANGALGGVLGAGETATLQWRAAVDLLCSGDRTFSSQAQITADNAGSALTDGDVAAAGIQATQAGLSVRCLSATAAGPGSVAGAGAGAVAVPTGATVSLAANSDAGAYFSHWSGGATGASNPLGVLMDTDKTIVATFSWQAPQAIAGFSATPSAPAYSLGGTFTIGATGGGSGSPLVFSSLTPAICTVAGAAVTMHARGVCTLAADQAGNAQYLGAPRVLLTLYLGVAPTGPAAIPTLSPWGLLLLGGLTALLAMRPGRRPRGARARRGA